jgi:cytidylate kinase
MTVVAISASYGAGGSQIAPAVAERLGVPFLDRAIPLAVAESLDVPLDDVEAVDEHARVGWLDRLLRGFIATDSSAPTPVSAASFTSEDFARAAEEVLRRHADTGEGVILGRAAVVVLRDRLDVLRVRLDGPPERRVDAAAKLGGIDREAARKALERFDRAHAEYARRFYGADIHDPSLYHVLLDSTAIELETCSEMIVTAVGDLQRLG